MKFSGSHLKNVLYSILFSLILFYLAKFGGFMVDTGMWVVVFIMLLVYMEILDISGKLKGRR